jgi:hypothetical protein
MRVNFHGLLRLFKRETQPQLWETLQYQIANSLLQDPQGERADNVEQAIHHYQQALEVHTGQRMMLLHVSCSRPSMPNWWQGVHPRKPCRRRHNAFENVPDGSIPTTGQPFKSAVWPI